MSRFEEILWHDVGVEADLQVRGQLRGTRKPVTQTRANTTQQRRSGHTYHVGERLARWWPSTRRPRVTILSRIIFSNERGGPFMPLLPPTLLRAVLCHATTPSNQPRPPF